MRFWVYNYRGSIASLDKNVCYLFFLVKLINKPFLFTFFWCMILHKGILGYLSIILAWWVSNSKSKGGQCNFLKLGEAEWNFEIIPNKNYNSITPIDLPTYHKRKSSYSMTLEPKFLIPKTSTVVIRSRLYRL